MRIIVTEYSMAVPRSTEYSVYMSRALYIYTEYCTRTLDGVFDVSCTVQTILYKLESIVYTGL